jgi:hypothetical protein
MIFYDIGALAEHDRRRLLAQLASDAAQPQIISTSSTPLSAFRRTSRSAAEAGHYERVSKLRARP